MKQELIKPIIKVGNSAGVLVPKSWLDGEAKVELISKPINIEKDVFEVLSPHLKDILGIYLVGSYARREETEKSDIDILAITNKGSKRMKKGRYDILLISKNDLEETLEKDAFPLIPMLKEAKPIVNKALLEKYLKIPLTESNLRWHIETTKSAVKINESLIDLSEGKKVSDKVSYSLILRLRGLYIIESLLKNKIPNKKSLISLIESVSGSKKAYEGYLRSKNNEKSKNSLPSNEAKKLINYIKKEVIKQEQWIKRKGRKK
jgi:predicted nucleotidyltransferase